MSEVLHLYKKLLRTSQTVFPNVKPLIRSLVKARCHDTSLTTASKIAYIKQGK
jgi:hypothetical protein